MYKYRIYCTDVISDIEMPQLVKSESEISGSEYGVNLNAFGPEIYISEGHFPDCFRRDKECYSEISAKECYLSNSYCFIYIDGDSRIVYEKRKDRSQKNLVTYLLGWGLSMLFYKRGVMAIHCSCVYDERGAILISGVSGAGKSTVTSYLLDKGYRFLADDVTMVGSLSSDGTMCATPAFPYRKLCRDVVEQRELDEDELIYIDEDKDKFLVPYSCSFADKPIKIRAVIKLVYSDSKEVTAKEISGFEKVGMGMSCLFMRPLSPQMASKPEVISVMLKLASAASMYCIGRPYGVDSRDDVFEKLSEIIA